VLSADAGAVLKSPRQNSQSPRVRYRLQSVAAKRRVVKNTTANMALKKVKGNFFERMFDKNLTDLVRGIRNNKDNEVSVSWTSWSTQNAHPKAAAHNSHAP